MTSSSSNDPIQNESWLRKQLKKAQEVGNNVGEGFGLAFRPTQEDRRTLVKSYRQDKERKAEPPSAALRFGEIPLVDFLRQQKTLNQGRSITDKGIANKTMALLNMVNPAPAFDDGMWAHRAQVGMNAAEAINIDQIPQPNKGETEANYVKRIEPDVKILKEQLARYNKGLQQQPLSKHIGRGLGSLTEDIVKDGGRSLWWLINAPQAIVNLGSEGAVALSSPDLMGLEDITDLEEAVRKGDLEYVEPINEKAIRIKNERIDKLYGELTQVGAQPEEIDDILNKEITQMNLEDRKDFKNYINKRPGVKYTQGGWRKRRFSPNAVDALAMTAPSLAINAGLGLMNIPDGYAAVVPQEDDATKTENMLAEVAARYILGREGKLLPWEDFSKMRPEASRQDYNKYKAYKFDKNMDLNPFDDGRVNIFNGLIRSDVTGDGLKGAEVEFLGRSMGVNDTLIPTIAALSGTALGAALPNIRQVRMKRDSGPSYGSEENKYRAKDANLITKAKGFMPEVAPRTPEGYRQPAPWAVDEKGNDTALGGAAKKVEQFFEEEPKINPDFLEGKTGAKQYLPARLKKRRVMGALAAGSGLAYGIGTLIGNERENRRRQQKFEDRGMTGDYQEWKKKGQEIYERKIELNKNNPNKDLLKDQSKTGFNKRGYQDKLQEDALNQQMAIEGIINQEAKRRAQAANQKRNDAMRQYEQTELTLMRKGDEGLVQQQVERLKGMGVSDDEINRLLEG